MTVATSGDIAFALPVFVFDGETTTSVTTGPNWVEVGYSGWTCRYETDGSLVNTSRVYGNRNGHYQLMEAKGKDLLTVRVKFCNRQKMAM